jgi:Xaa-Pro aminopeptidase
LRYADRRRRVLDALGAEGALVLAAAPELRVGRDTELRYAVDADVRWLTGYEEPDCVIVLCPSAAGGAFTMFVRPRDPALELWTGPRGGPEAALERFGADQAFPITELTAQLPGLIADARVLHVRLRSGNAALDTLAHRLLEEGRRRRAREGTGAQAVVEPGAILDDLRLVKDDDEIAALRSAVDVTVDSFADTLAQVRSAGSEAAVEALLESAFRRRGASGPAFPSIIAAGENATVLHYVRNAGPLHDGQLLLMDAGARVAGYCGDVTRTVPVGGRFHSPHAEVYDIVLAARNAAIDAVRPGGDVAAVHDAAFDALLAGLRDAGLVAADEQEARESVLRFFPHRTSHWLGLDVHDVGDYVRAGAPRALATGMVLTVEPGLYFANRDDVPPHLRGIGIRIEDDVLVTPEGAEVLSGRLPADRAGVGALLGCR